jgi:hypothetical protein
MNKKSLLLFFLLLPAAANAQVKLELASATLQVEPHTGKASGVVKITLGDTDPATVTLRASPLAQGDSYAFVRFDASHADTVGLELKALNCQPALPCQIPFTVADVWKSGLYQGTITASSSSATLASLPLSAVRSTPSFQPILTSDALHGGRLVVDATSQSEFLLSVQNPAGARPGEFALAGSADTDLHCAPPGPLIFSPARFHLEPEASQTVIAAVGSCVPAGQRFLVLRISGGAASGPAVDRQAADVPAADPAVSDRPTSDPPALDNPALDIIVAVTRHQAGRTWTLLLWVVFGSFISLLLNNIFPVNRARAALRASLRQVKLMLRDCGQAAAALVDGLAAEARRLELSLKQVHFFSATKVNEMQAAQASVATLATATALARRISQARSASDSATLPIVTHAAIRQKLRDAEDALRGGDPQAAGDRLAEAQSKLTEAQNDVQQTALAAMLDKQLTKMMTERGRIVPPPVPADAAAAQPAVQGAAAQAAGRLVQDPARNPRIRDLVDQLARDMTGVGTLDAREVLDVERDLYIADVWTEYVEPKLRANPARFAELADSLLDSLLRNPKSDQVQTLLDLLRSETTPQEIALSLGGNEGWVECETTRPRALQSVDIAFAFNHPALQAVPAAKRLLIYDWNTGDDTTPPPSVDRFSHYFRGARRGLWFRRGDERSYTVTLGIRVPFTANTGTFPFGTVITPRLGAAEGWRLEPMEVASFFISAAIATATAFGTQYASGLPDEITWATCSSAFMLGFGLDQLRDTISPAASVSSPASAPAASAPAPRAAHPAP